MKRQPGPSDMLEELADKAIAQMSRLAVTSFETALDELVDFHKFLIDAYTTTDETGNAFSFAQIGDFRALHEDWIRQYRRLFERAVEYIGRENDFVDLLAHVALRLLPPDARRTPIEVAAGLLDLHIIFVHRLEDWLTRHRSPERMHANGGHVTVGLAGFDRQAYEDAVVAFVGAWGSTLQVSSHIFSWKQREVEFDEQWRRYIASWPFLQRHLKNTGYLLAVSVWNEDETGANYFCQALLRWLDGFSHELEEEHHLFRPLLLPTILEKDWTKAKDALAPLLWQPEWDKPSPTGVFTAMLRVTHEDVVFIMAGVILAWYGERRHSIDIAAKIVYRLLTNDAEDRGALSSVRETGFRPLMLNFARIFVSGDRFEQLGYGGWLDRLVELCDSMTERRVVPGHVYTPSTRHNRDDLLLPWLACLAAFLPEEGDGDAVRSIARLTEREDAFLQGDESLRTLLHGLSNAKAALASQNQDYLARAILGLKANAETEKLTERLAAILDDAIKTIESQRNERLRGRTVDPSKLDAIRQQVERAITLEQGGLTVFRNFAIVQEKGDLPKRELPIGEIKKGFLTDTPMAQEPGNLWEWVAGRVQNFAVRWVWNDFAELPRRVMSVHDEASYLVVLTEEASRLLQTGQQPVLLVNQHDDPPWVHEWFGWRGNRPEGLQVSRKKGQTPDYVGTVNSVDVYRADLNPNESLLFSGSLLRTVMYGTNVEGHIVTVEFVDGEEGQPGKLVFRFSQATEWAKDQIVSIQYSGSPASDDEQKVL